MKKYWFIILAVCASLLFSACQPQNENPSQMPSPYPSGEIPNPYQHPYPPIEPAEEEQVVKAALQKVSEILGKPQEVLKVQKVESKEWANACLELPHPDEACAEMIVNGYRIQLLVEGKTVFVHTNQDGSVVRIAGENEMGDISDKAKNYLVEKLGIPTEEITILEVQEVEWPDSCLGVVQPDQVCLQVITPGYRIVVEVKGKKIILHTDREGKRILQAKR